ncbi:hypothetical protein HZC00_01335 [Candidatus Kaiserbacteria bacterium]|nr:hypothetical protein [Candidatus Kaiserbacteria bacterium]
MQTLIKSREWVFTLVGFGIGAFIALMMTVYYHLEPLLEDLSYASQVVLAALAFVAVYQYVYQKRKDRIDAVSALLDITRDDIIPLHSKIQSAIVATHGTNGSYTFLSTRMESFDRATFLRTHTDVAREQARIYLATNSLELRQDITTLGNLMEEFALRVIEQKATHEKAMESIIPIFVVIVEQFAVYFIVQGLYPGNGTFPGIRTLYNTWKDSPSVNRNASVREYNSAVGELLRPAKAILLNRGS